MSSYGKVNIISGSKWLKTCIILLFLTLTGGWFITAFLADKARQEIIEHNESIVSLHGYHLTAEFEKIERAVKTMSESPLFVSALTSLKQEDIARACWVLDRFNKNYDIAVSYIMDSNGLTIASSNRDNPDSFVGKSYHFRPYFTEAIKGFPSRYFALGATSFKRGFYASHPVRNYKGVIVGVAAIKQDVDPEEGHLAKHPNFFLIDPNGVIFLSGRKDMNFKSLWPLSRETQLALIKSKQFGEKEFKALLPGEISDMMEIMFEGKKQIASRKVINPEGWSIVLMTTMERVILYRLAGVIMTILVCVLIITPFIIHYRALISAQAVREREILLRNIINSSKDYIFVKDLRLRTILCNEAFAAAQAKVPEDLIGKTDIENGWDPEFIKGNPENGISGIEQDDLAVLRGETLHIMYEPGNVNGAIRFFNTIKLPLRDLHGNIMGVLGLSRDVTEHKLIVEALRESEQKYSLTFKTSPDAVNINRLEDGLFVDVNEGFTRLTGFSSEEVIGRSSMEINIWNEASDRQCLVRNLKEKGYCENLEAIFRKKDGSLINGLMSARIISLKGIPHIISISRDITELRKLEAKKAELDNRNRQLQKAESLTLMAGAIAHNFNNQLGVVIGNLELAMNYLSGTGGPADFIEKAMKAACKASDTSGLMLTYLGHTEDKSEPLDLSLICLQKLNIIRNLMPEEFDLETDLPSRGPVIEANEKQILQAITNLVANAWEAMGDRRGIIKLSVKTVSTAGIPAFHRFPVNWEAQANEYACIEVSDKGCGIDSNDIEKIFDPFYSSKFTGRGLGLPAVLGIARAYSGVITVQSNPGEGSAFSLFFPVSFKAVQRREEMPALPVMAKAAESDESRQDGKGKTVLLVDDEAAMRKVAGIMLTHIGYTVIEAKNGVDALDALRQHRDIIRCVLCDLTMPGMDGWETMAALNKIAPSVPVVITSGYDQDLAMAGRSSEFPQHFLSKPYQIKELGEAICRAVSGQEDEMPNIGV